MNHQDITLVNNMELFIERLMKENSWTRPFTQRVIDEYKKFIFMAIKHRVAPSYEIDQVWHTHILFTKEYQAMCDTFVGTFLHHNPTDTKHVRTIGKDEYMATKEAYRWTFGQEPPNDIWTNWKKSHYVYINLFNNWVIPHGDWKTLIKTLIKTLKSKLWGYFHF